MDRVPAPLHAERAVELARAGFSKRRKMLRASLAGTVADPTGLLVRAGFEPTQRAETLGPADFLDLAVAQG
jgi:16S rRNA A1518/A1519 N6-dimethyltransferase RsmA/KsgA/DIM1 with predicted DNA glycosylase/AP lyase activity